MKYIWLVARAAPCFMLAMPANAQNWRGRGDSTFVWAARIGDGGTLTISLEARNGGARIRFQDTGFGLSEDELKGLFVPFNSSFKNGTGLGLPIVYQIVNAHNGTIAARSRKGVGTMFIIDL